MTVSNAPRPAVPAKQRQSAPTQQSVPKEAQSQAQRPATRASKAAEKEKEFRAVDTVSKNFKTAKESRAAARELQGSFDDLARESYAKAARVIAANLPERPLKERLEEAVAQLQSQHLKMTMAIKQQNESYMHLLRAHQNLSKKHEYLSDKYELLHRLMLRFVPDPSSQREIDEYLAMCRATDELRDEELREEHRDDDPEAHKETESEPTGRNPTSEPTQLQGESGSAAAGASGTGTSTGGADAGTKTTKID